MSITSLSTLEQIEAEYIDTSDYGNDLVLARRFQKAVRALLIKKPNRSQLATMSIQFDIRLLKEELDRVTDLIDFHPDNVGPSMRTSADLRDYRG